MSVLEKIFATKREEVANAMAQVSPLEIRSLANDQAEPLGFRAALESSVRTPSLIAEVKKASPSKGLIRPDFDPVSVGFAYLEAGVQCLSVLTDEQYFQGAPENLKLVKEATGLPCLRKDFIYDAYQVYQARAWGADSILLIAAGLELSQAADLMGLASELRMDTLFEVHNEEEAEMALELECGFVGVNNRDLRNFETSLGTSATLMPILKNASAGVTLVSESALETHADIQTAASFGARAVLIGTTFCASPNIASKVREVMGW